MYTNSDGFENTDNRAEYYENEQYMYSDENEENQNQNEGVFEEPAEGLWAEHCSLTYSNSAVTYLAYDSNLELLWASYEDGRVSSFAMKFESSSEEFEQPRRYSSFLSGEEAVLQVITLPSCVLSVSMSAIQMHTVGGLSTGKFCTAPTGTTEEGEEAFHSFTCAAALRPPGALVTADSVGDTHILVGTSSNFAYLYDINVLDGDPQLVYDVCCPTVCVRASEAHLAVAGTDGKVRLLDSRLRNMNVTHTFDAHTGPVRDLCLQPDGVTMLTCGMVSRPVNPFDPKSPVNYLPDPLVKVFDLRTHRQLSPMSMSVSSPSFVLFVPNGSRSEEGSAAAVLLGASTGVLQICPVSADQTNSQMMYAPLSDRKEVVTAVTVSSSGQVMCVGTSTGAIAQYTLRLPEGTSKKINDASVAMHLPPFTPAAPLLSLSASALVLGSAYTLRPGPSDPTPLASSFHSTPGVRNRRLRLTSARRISEEVMKRTNQQDFIGTVPNIGFRANSMLYGSAANRAYAVCDPRKRLEEQQRQAGGSVEGGAGGGAGPSESHSLPAERLTPLGGSVSAKGTNPSAASFEPPAVAQMSVPATVRRVHSHRGKLRIKEFNYDALNATPFVGLENTAPNAYTNPILQVFFALPEVRECALAAQTAVYHHSNATSLWCELGFLFHMMTAVEGYASTVPIQRVVTPSNFQRTFQQIPESVALGLLDNKETSPPPPIGGDTTAPATAKAATSASIDTQQMSQVFCRFLFQQLHREADLAILAKNRSAAAYSPSSLPSPAVAALNTIDSVFGYSIATTTTFLQSGTIELGSANKAYSLEVVYPILGKNTNTRNPRPSPSQSSSVTPSAVLLSLAANRERTKEKVATAADTDGASVPVAEESKTTEKAAVKASRIAAPAVGAVPSFASVLWGSYQRETHMRGWCSASETYEPFKQVRSLLSLPKVLTLLCGDTVRDPRDATLSGALGEAQSYGSMHANFWSQGVDLSHFLSSESSDASHPGQRAPWLPVAIELAVYRSHGTSTGSVYAQGRERAGSQGGGQPSKGAGGAIGGRLGAGGKGDKDKLVVSGRMLRVTGETEGREEVWSIFDGATETLSNLAASRLPEYGIMSTDEGDRPGQGWEVYRYSLFAAVSHVVTSAVPAPSAAAAATPATPGASAPVGAVSGATVVVEGPKHSILHIRRKPSGGWRDDKDSRGDWWMFNDFVLQPSDEKSAVTYNDWRHPSTLFFGREDYQYDSHADAVPPSAAGGTAAASGLTVSTASVRQIVPSSVLLLPSLSQTPCVRLVAATAGPSPRNQSKAASVREKEREEELSSAPPPLPERGDLIAFDGEFVSVQAERVILNAEGQKVIKEEGRMLLARISIISDEGSSGGDSAAYRLLVDDYILPSEPVIDYVTRFSGIVPEDLNPSQSRHAVVPYRTAYLKLRFFLDRGCVFVGHGLQKDFETANIFVPPEQIIDTVELWRLPNKRKASLRFLAAYLLKADIQDEIHDSIEDAKTALQLYRHYEAACALGPEHLHATLQELYAYGARTNWTIGLDQLQS